VKLTSTSLSLDRVIVDPPAEGDRTLPAPR
jgi:hypothetical protein